MAKFSKSEIFQACERCIEVLEVIPPTCIKGEVHRSGGNIEPPECMLPFLPDLITNQSTKRTPESQAESQKDEKRLAPHEKSSAAYEDRRSKIENISQNSNFRQPTSSMCREDRKKHRRELVLNILKLITFMYHVSQIARLLNLPRSTVQYWLRKLEERGLIKPDGKSSPRSYPKIYALTTAGTKFLIHNEGGSAAHEPLFNFKYTWHALSFKSEILGGARPKGDHSYNPTNWKGEVFYRDGYKIRLTTKHAIVDINQDLGADTEADLLLKYHTLAQSHLRQFSKQYDLQLSSLVEQNREPHRAIPGSHDLAQKMLGSMGGELHNEATGLQVDESDKDHRGEVEFVGEKGAKAAEEFLHLVNKGPLILADTKAKVDNFEKVLHSEIREIKADLREIKTEVKELPLTVKLQQKEQEIEELRARLQEYGSQMPKEKSKPTYSGVEFG
ncbi:Uncharacterised protein [uncultured archaeon]|nr:Uncharacterised protein [uncultured archaeon]